MIGKEKKKSVSFSNASHQAIYNFIISFEQSVKNNNNMLSLNSVSYPTLWLTIQNCIYILIVKKHIIIINTKYSNSCEIKSPRDCFQDITNVVVIGECIYWSHSY